MNLFLRFAHNYLDWHFNIENVGFDGVSFTAKCETCGKRLLMDSMGNWFAAKQQTGEAK